MAIKARNSVTVADVSDGTDGTGISSTTVEYQAGSSGTSKPTGTWSTTIPATSASAPYLWTRVTYRYSDGRSPLEVFSVGATPESIEIGGRNVIRNSAFINGLKYWTCYGNTSSVDTDRTFNGHPTIKVCNTGLTESRWYGPCTYYLPQNPTSILAGEAWTVSCYYYVEDASTIDGELILEVKGKKEGATSNSMIVRTTSLKSSNTVEGAWTKIKKTFTATEDHSNCHVFAWTSRNGTVWFADFKLEKGNKATDWTPAPEDAEDAISNLEDWKTEASQKITKDGIIATVGNYYAYQTDMDSVKNRVTEAETQILQQADKIELRVEKAGIISAINQTAETVKISAARITLAGATIADSFTATNLHITGNSTFDGILNGATGSFSGNIMAATLVVDNKISMNTAYGTTGKLFSTGESMDLPNVLWVDFDQIFSDVKFMSSYVDFYGEVYVERGISVGDTISAEGVIRSEDSVTAGGMASIEVDSEGGSLNVLSASGILWHIDSPLGGLRFCSQNDGAVRMELGRWGGLSLYNSGLEIYCSTPYIDFHFGYSNSDYTSRIIEYEAGFLRVEAALYTRDYSGTYRRPVTSANGETNQVVMLSTSTSTKLSITGSWGDASTYTAKTITVSSSDIRLKESVKPSTVDALSLINKIKIRQFRWKDSGEHQNIGFIADELENLDEKLAVGGGYTEDGFMNVKSVDDFYLLGYLTKGVQELDQKYDLKVSELESKNEQLTVRIECRQDEQQILIEQLMDENAELKKRVAQLEEQNSTT